MPGSTGRPLIFPLTGSVARTPGRNPAPRRLDLSHLPNANQAEWWLAKAARLEQQGDYQGALECFEGALKQ